MRTRRRHRHVAWTLLVFVTAAATPLHAQQTIFNVPSPDVLKKGEVYVEVDASLRPMAPRFSAFVPRLVVGVGRSVEAGVNVAGNTQPGADRTTLVPTVKWRAYDGGENGWSVIAGTHLFLPVQNRSYDAGNYSYAQVTRVFGRGTRLSGGACLFTQDVVAPANRGGGQFIIEHPLRPNLTLAADWYTGSHALGYFTPGVIWKPHPKVTLYTGYSLGNRDVEDGNHFFLVEVGVNLR